MSLNLIQHEKIPKMFNYLEKEMEELFQKGNALFRKKMNMYWSRIFFRTCGNWIAGTVWLPVKGYVFNQHVRTNNDAEGWHNRINERARTKMNFYELVPKLFSEAKMIPLQKRLLCRDRILKRCRKVTAGVNAKLIELWDYYPAFISCKQLLKKVSEIYDSVINELNDARCYDDDKDDLCE
jgi:hypothetical protein